MPDRIRECLSPARSLPVLVPQEPVELVLAARVPAVLPPAVLLALPREPPAAPLAAQLLAGLPLVARPAPPALPVHYPAAEPPGPAGSPR